MLYTIHFTLHIIHFTSYIIHFRLYILHYTLYIALYIIHDILYTIHYTLYIGVRKVRKVALCDFLTRRFFEAARQAGADQRTQSRGWGGAKGGEITIDEPGQHMLERTSVLVDDCDGSVEARFFVAMPAKGKRVWVRGGSY